MLSLLLAFLQAPGFDGTPQVPASLSVYAYEQEIGLRDQLIAKGRMYDDIGAFILGESDPELAERFQVKRFELPALAENESLVVVIRHDHHGLAEPDGRLLWSSPDKRATIRALNVQELKKGLNAGYRCHGAFRLVQLNRPIQPVKPSGLLQRSITPNPTIQAWVAQVSQQNLEDGVDTLVAFNTREHYTQGEVNAQNWIRDEMNAMGLNTSLFNYDSGADVVIGELPGQGDPSKIVIIGGHYDSINYSGSSAPGADDDASGVSAVLEIARILSSEDFNYTIRFCGWSGEEYGLLGSDAYAGHLASINAEVVGMVQLDMIAYRANGDSRSVDFVTNDTDPALNQFSMDAYAAYVPGLQVKSGSLSGGTSDHRPFHQRGFPACFPFEDVGQYSPYIHSASDIVGVSANDFVLATQITQGALATIAELARPLSMQLSHTALDDTQDEVGPYTALLTATPLNNETISGVDLLYRVDGGNFQTVAMSPTGMPDEWGGDIPGQVSPAVVEYYLIASDTGGNQAWLPDGFTPGQTFFRFNVGLKQTVFFDDFETDKGWTHAQVQTQDDWQRGIPNGASGTSSGVSWSDPGSAYSGQRVWGNDLAPSGYNGSYQPNVHNWLESPPLDCSQSSDTRLRFQRWLTIEDGQYDQAEIKINGNLVWSNPTGTHTLDTSWQDVDLDISQYADGNGAVKVRFILKSDGGLELGGWNIDDVEVYSLSGSGGGMTLAGSTNGAVGLPVSYTISNAPANAPYWIYYSLNLNGTVINGTNFEIGDPYFTATTGTTDGSGSASWTSAGLPPKAAGRTVYVEARADEAGQSYDSNVVTLVVQ